MNEEDVRRIAREEIEAHMARECRLTSQVVGQDGTSVAYCLTHNCVHPFPVSARTPS